MPPLQQRSGKKQQPLQVTFFSQATLFSVVASSSSSATIVVVTTGDGAGAPLPTLLLPLSSSSKLGLGSGSDRLVLASLSPVGRRWRWGLLRRRRDQASSCSQVVMWRKDKCCVHDANVVSL